MFHSRRIVLRSMLVLAVAAGCITATTASSSADSLRNGPIAFGRWNPSIGDFSLWTARSNGSHQRQLTSMPSFFSDWMPDGSGLAFDYFDDIGEHVATIRPDGTGFRQLTFSVGIQKVPRYAPDGRHIVFIRRELRESGHGPRLMTISGRPVTEGGESHAPIPFQPDCR
jgi:Tol biopolymer transport system component